MTGNTPEAWDGRSVQPLSWDAAMWSEHGQVQRFLTVLSHLQLRDSDSLLDYGCGTGRFCEFLPRDVTYYAYDTSPGMRSRVRRDYSRAWVLDAVPDLEFDHIVCIGTFNLADNWSKDETWGCLTDLWEMNTPRTLIASLYRGDDDDCLDYRPEEVADFADTQTSSFLIDCTHLSNDLILVMRS